MLLKVEAAALVVLQGVYNSWKSNWI